MISLILSTVLGYTTVNPADVKPVPGTGRPVVTKCNSIAQACEENEILHCTGEKEDEYCECAVYGEA